MKNIVLWGSTGSIGTQTLDVVRSNPKEYNIIGLSCKNSIELMEKQVREFRPKFVAVENERLALKLKERLEDLDVNVGSGMASVACMADLENIDLVVNALVGTAGLVPTLRAVKNGINIALANKETLVTAGEIVMAEAFKRNVKIIPVDSEHNAIFQCLMGNNHNDISKIILTASGGPFRGKKKKDLMNITAAEALKHPKWNMGKKISIDSATLMNKGLEVIEAKWLFDLEVDKIDVVTHPQSIVHSMVEYKDRSVIAQLAVTDMRIPIQFALGYPLREKNDLKLDLIKVGTLTFEEPDMDTFPCLKLAYEAIKVGGSLPTVLNAVNEVAVEKFLSDKISFYDIPKLIEKALEKHELESELTIEKIIAIDQWAREFTQNII